MDNVIKFPTKEELTSKKIENWIRETCKKGGLSDEMIDDVISEYKPFHKELFPRYESVMKIPGNIGLSLKQIDSITRAHNKCIKGAFDHFLELQAHAAHIIIGLIARNRLNQR